MTWRVEFARHAARDLEQLERQDRLVLVVVVRVGNRREVCASRG